MPDISRSQFFWLAGVLCTLWVGLYLLNPFAVTQRQFTDVFAGQGDRSNRILLIQIDDKSLREIGRWPWPRFVFASFLQQVQPAATVGIDVSFSEPSRFDPADDKELAQAIQQADPDVILPAQLQQGGLVTPIPKLQKPASVGFSNITIDNDGVVRRAYLSRQGTPSFSLQLYRHHKKKVKSLLPQRFEQQPHRIRWTGSAGSYPTVSFVDVLNDRVPRRIFKNRIVIVGVTASDITSLYDTPMGLMSGAEIHANVTDMLIQGQFFQHSPLLDIGFILLLTGLGIFLAFRARNLVRLGWQSVFSVAVYIAIVGFAYGALVRIDPLYPLIGFVGSVVITIAYEYITVAQQKEVAQRSFQVLNTMVKSITDGVIMTDVSGQVVVANPAAKSALGISKDSQLELQDVNKQLPDEIEILEVVQGVQQSGEVFSQRDLKIRDTYYRINVAPVTQSGKQTDVDAGAVIVLQDMTQEKEIERVRENFTSMMVHELRSPLDAIRKMSNRLGSDEIDADREEKYTNLIQSNADQMLTLVNDLLDVAKLEAGKFELNKQTVAIGDLLRDRIDFYEQLAESRELQTSIDENVPETISADPDRVNQVLNNLLSNAIKFTDTEDTITVAAQTCKGHDLQALDTAYGDPYWTDTEAIEPDRSYVCVSVRDTGDGIAEDNISQLFDKFKQFESAAKSDKKGTGLGMVIIKGITESHDGVVGVASTKGEGTEFVIALPAGEN